jgi:hypothetical protein
MIAGASAAMFLAFREFAPAYVENWGQGSEGELKTHKALAALDWVLVEDVDTGRGNYDHLLVGPPGVFMIETKNLTGITEIRNGAAWLRRRHDPDGDQPQTRLQSSVLGASAEVSRAIREQSRRREWVRAIVVFWNEFPQGLVETDKIAYVHGGSLKAYLETLPPSLNEAAQDDIGRVLRQLKEDGERRAAVKATTARPA